MKEFLHNVTVDNLDEHHCPIVGHDVEGLGLDIGVRVCAPAQNLLIHIGEGSGLGLLRNRLDSLWAIDRLLGAHYGGETARIESVSNHNKERSIGTYVDLSQFIISIRLD
jgi:hypothetical protein